MPGFLLFSNHLNIRLLDESEPSIIEPFLTWEKVQHFPLVPNNLGGLS